MEIIKSELVPTVYSLLERIQTVYRLHINGGRVYYTLDSDNNPIFFISLTTMIRATSPKPEQLIKWIADQGYEQARAYMQERASYGSIMHWLIGRFITTGKHDFKFTDEICATMAASQDWQWKAQWADDLNSDMAAFMQFVVDKKVKPLAVEIVLVSNEGYGTAIDLVCEMEDEYDGLDANDPYKSGARKGQPREVKLKRKITALMNFKSRRTGAFYEDEEIQVEFEKRLFNESYPEIHIDKIFNWSPKEWRGSTPTYSLKDQSDSLNKDKANAILEIAKIELMKKLPDQVVLAGETRFGELPKIETIPIAELIKLKHTAQDEIESNGISTETVTAAS